jgi:hypothetical protein
MATNETFNNLVNTVKKNSNNGMILTILIFFMIILFIIYAYINIRKQQFNCEVLSKNRLLSMYSVGNPANRGSAYDLALKECNIKTAYNCCCTGDFRNDYVDYCALLNCAKMGFRALDFQIFSLGGKPVVSESTASNNNYKEMFNSLPFTDVLTNIKRYFIQDVTNCPNVSDPLFLIFRFKTNNTDIFDLVANALNVAFGSASSLGNQIYVPQLSLDNAKISDLMRKIIIIVDTTGLTKFENSKLYPITALKLGTVNNQIYRESDVVSNMLNNATFTDLFENYVNIIYPDVASSSENYDFVTTGINSGIQFIAVNAQTPDIYLDTYNTKYFNKYAITEKIQSSTT